MPRAKDVHRSAACGFKSRMYINSKSDATAKEGVSSYEQRVIATSSHGVATSYTSFEPTGDQP